MVSTKIAIGINCFFILTLSVCIFILPAGLYLEWASSMALNVIPLIANMIILTRRRKKIRRQQLIDQLLDE